MSEIWQPSCIFGLVWLIGLIYVLIWRPTKNTPTNADTVERQHLVKRVSDGYPVHVNDTEYSAALRSGDYEPVAKNTGGDYYYSDGERQNLYVPPGYREKR